MERTAEHFLELLATAMETKDKKEMGNETVDASALYSLAASHQVIPMVHRALLDTGGLFGMSENERKRWDRAASQSGLSQMYRTMEFLKAYEQLNQAGIRALVVKGIILRSLYPDPYYRRSGDEDLYIRKEDFREVDRILQSLGMVRKDLKQSSESKGEEAGTKEDFRTGRESVVQDGQSREEKHGKDQETDEDQYTYTSLGHGLVIELHLRLFPKSSAIFGHLNRIFESSFEESIVKEIDGIRVHTMDVDRHLLYLAFHTINHFLYSGVGIRQVCDLVMYIHAYGKVVDWEWFWKELDGEGYTVLMLNLLDIGTRYLGLDASLVRYPASLRREDFHSQTLLEDILDAGIFGKRSVERIHTTLITQNAIMNRGRLGGRWVILRKAVFPKATLMGEKFLYSARYPILLPVAWLHRLGSYAIRGRTFRALHEQAKSSIMLGNRRIEILKEYEVIKT